MKTALLIPAKGTSRGIPRKNLVDLCGHPLVWWTIRQALESDADDVIVSSDDQEILALARSEGATALLRPAELATDTASTESVMVHIFEARPAITALLVLQPTSPLKLSVAITDAADYLSRSGTNLVSVVRSHRCPWRPRGAYREPDALWPKDAKGNRLRRQDWPGLLVENGAIYGVHREMFFRTGSRFSPPVSLYLMEEWTQHEVDSPHDLEIMRFVLGERLKQGCNGVTT